MFIKHSELASVSGDPNRDNFHIEIESDEPTEVPSPDVTPLRESDDEDDNDDLDLPILIRFRGHAFLTEKT